MLTLRVGLRNNPPLLILITEGRDRPLIADDPSWYSKLSAEALRPESRSGRTRTRRGVGVNLNPAPYFTWSVSTADDEGTVSFADDSQTTTSRRFAPVEVVYQSREPIVLDGQTDGQTRFVVVVKDELGRATTVNVSIVQGAPVILHQGSTVSELSFVSYEGQDYPSFRFELSADYTCALEKCLQWTLSQGVEGVKIPGSVVSGSILTAGAPTFTVSVAPRIPGNFSGTTFSVTVAGSDSDKSARVVVTITARKNRASTITGITGDTTQIQLHQAERTTVLTFAGDRFGLG